MKTKIVVLIVEVLCFGFLAAADAQQTGKMPRIGYIGGGTGASGSSSLLAGFREGLRDYGYVEGKNILVEYRFAEGDVDRVPGLVAELVQLNVDAIVSTNFSAIVAAKKMTQTMPVVMVTTQDPVAGGVVESFTRPGGNITGLTRLTRDSSGKRLELLRVSCRPCRVSDSSCPRLALAASASRNLRLRRRR